MAPPPTDSALRLAELIAALSLPTDLATGQPLEHALRSCVLATRLGEALALDDADLRAAYYLALLQMIGCTAEQHVPASAFGDEHAAGTWFATVDAGRPAQAMATMVRHLGADQPPWRRARMLVNAFATMPKVMATRAAHCDVARLLAERLGFGPEM